jgi:ABC-type Mn2+/Zn2+ transport system permease subunit
MPSAINEILSLELFRHAVIAGALLAVIFGVLSFFIVTRGLAFMGAGIAHTAFGGVAVGIALGIDPFISALAFCVISALIISRVSVKGGPGHDTAIGIFFSFSMALGAIIISMQKGYTFDLMGYLFGNILSISARDIILTAVLLGAVLPPAYFFFQRIVFASFDSESAKAAGINTELIDSVLLVYLAASIVVSMKAAGIILVSALTVLPASFGLLFAKSLKGVITAGVIYSVCIMEGGLLLSFVLDTPPGATMVVSGTAVYFAGIAVKRFKKA